MSSPDLGFSVMEKITLSIFLAMLVCGLGCAGFALWVLWRLA